MKRIISILVIISAFLVSCSEEIAITPGISFLTPTPEVYEEAAIFRIVGQPFTSADSLQIPVTLGGTAQKGVDYDISEEYFTLTQESLMDSIVVYTKTLGTGKSVSLSLQIPEGFVSGKYSTSEFNLQNKYGLLNFETQRAFVTDSTAFAIILTDSTGMTKALTRTTPIDFSVNTERSTAVEGVDFKLVNTEDLNIPAGSAYTSFGIIPLKANFEVGKDKVVLNLVSNEKFDTGINPELEVTLLHQDLKLLEGTWYMDSVVTDSLYFENIWGTECTGYSQVPEFYTSNMFSVSFLGASFSPSFVFGLESYFIGTSAMDLGKELEIIDVNGQAKMIQLISLNNTNRYFSKTEQSEDTQSYIGVYIFKDAESQKDMMELYVLDHTSKTFMPELGSGSKYGTEKPVAAEPGLYFCATFVRL